MKTLKTVLPPVCVLFLFITIIIHESASITDPINPVLLSVTRNPETGNPPATPKAPVAQEVHETESFDKIETDAAKVGEHLIGSIAFDPSALQDTSQETIQFTFPTRSGYASVKLNQGRSLSADQSSWQWTGVLDSVPFSAVSATRWKGHTFISVNGASVGIYELRQKGDGPMDVIHFNTSSLPACESEADGLAHDYPHEHTDNDAVYDNFQNSEADEDTPSATTFIDVVIGYNDDARTNRGGTVGDPSDNGAVESRILGAVADANTTYSNSGLDLQMRVAWLGQIDYTADPDVSFSVALSQLGNYSDGLADELTAKKIEYQADFASLWIPSNVSGGRAYVLNASSSPDLAINVVRVQNPVSTFVHEIGHNMGGRHIESSYGSSPSRWYSYSFAHQFSVSGTDYATVLCSFSDISSSNRILYLSNPDINFLGEPTGVSNSADMALTVQNNLDTYEGWFDTPERLPDILEAGEGSYTITQNFGFVGETYQLLRTEDLSEPIEDWANVGSYSSDTNGDASASDSGAGAQSFYRWATE
ncbi:MAG: M12 family metallo-peptidase [Opitutales bacterium]